MNKGLWISRKNHLLTLMQRVSSHYGGDESEFFNACFLEAITLYSDEKIECVIACYTELLTKLK